MNIFNSLGSNYTFKTALGNLFIVGTIKDKLNLINFLDKKYSGETHLFYKGRQAIEAGLKLCNFEMNSAVVINGFTCKVVETAVVNAGLSIICLDPDLKTLNFSAQSLQNILKLNKNVRAVIVQHTLGITAEIEKISKICKKNNLILIEDLAHTTEEGKYGDFVALSFSQDKIIDAVSGGALIIKNKKYKDKFNLKLTNVSLLQQIKDKFYPILTFKIRKTYKLSVGKVLHALLKKTGLMSDPIGPRMKLSKLPNWYSTIALKYLKNLNDDMAHRKRIVDVYKKNLDKSIQFQGESLVRFPVFVKNRVVLIQVLKETGVYVSDIWYDNPVVESEVSKNILNLPTHKNVNKKDALKITQIINKCINTKQKK